MLFFNALLMALALFGAGVVANKASAAEICSKLIATGNPEYPPYLWRSATDASTLVGANADLMHLLSREIGIPIEIKYVGPWARVLEETKLGRIDLIAGAFFTMPRLDFMDYVYPAFRDTRSVLWTRQGAGFNYQKWEDLKGHAGVTVINNSFGEDFDRYAQSALKISTVASVEQAFKMLQLGRVDYLVYEEDPGLAYIAKLEIRGVMPVRNAVSNEQLYLTISHKSPCNTGEIRAALARAMYKLSKQNTMKKLVSDNIQLWRVK